MHWKLISTKPSRFTFIIVVPAADNKSVFVSKSVSWGILFQLPSVIKSVLRVLWTTPYASPPVPAVVESVINPKLSKSVNKSPNAAFPERVPVISGLAIGVSPKNVN